MAIAPVKKPNLTPSNGPAPAKGPPFVDALAQRLGLKPVDVVALLDDPAVLEVIAAAVEEHTGTTPEEGNAVEAQLARTLKGPRLAKALALQRATVAARASKARR